MSSYVPKSAALTCGQSGNFGTNNRLITHTNFGKSDDCHLSLFSSCELQWYLESTQTGYKIVSTSPLFATTVHGPNCEKVNTPTQDTSQGAGDFGMRHRGGNYNYNKERKADSKRQDYPGSSKKLFFGGPIIQDN